MKARSSQRQPTAPSSHPTQTQPAQRGLGGFQSALGNQLTVALLSARGIQAKLRLGGRNDPLEREADRAADTVLTSEATLPAAEISLNKPAMKRKVPGGAEGKEVDIPQIGGGTVAPAVPEKPAEEDSAEEKPEETREEEEEEPPIQAMLQPGGAPAAASAPPPLHGGRPLSAESRAFFEPRFGAGFGGVRVHTGPAAVEGARSLGARAYTRGSHVAFDQGEYAPQTPRGKRLLAHELTHVIQQSAAPRLAPAKAVEPRPDPQRPSDVHDQLGEGQPLPAVVRSRMERGLGGSLAGVRLHTDATARRLAGHLKASAFAVGSHVAFAAGRYRPGTPYGDALLAHELAHTMQQGEAAEAAGSEASSTGYEALEQEADGSAARATAALWAPGLRVAAGRSRPSRHSGLRLSRCGGGGGATGKDTVQIGKHTTANFILEKPSPKRSNTDPSSVKLKDQSFSASVVEDKPAKQWKYRLDSIDSKGKMQIVYFTEDHYPAPKPTDDSGALSNVNSGNWKTIVSDLEKNKEGIPDFWSAYRAEDLHESFHWRNEWQTDAKREFAIAETDIDKLSVSQADAADAGAAEAKLKGPATKAFNDSVTRAKAAYAARGDNPGDPPYKAQAPAVQALADRVKAHATKEKWP